MLTAAERKRTLRKFFLLYQEFYKVRLEADLEASTPEVSKV